jgi:hypothetical protein
VIVGFGTFFAGVTVVPMGIILHRVRRLLKAGFGRDELAVAYKAEIERAREEGAFSFGHRPSVYERVVRAVCGSTLGVAIISGIAMTATSGDTHNALGVLFALSLTTGIGAGVLATVRLQSRRDIRGEMESWFWRSRLGRWVFKAAGIGLKRVAAGGSPTYRPTEFAIGLEAERLFDDLPRTTRKSLGDLPEVVRKLETDAQKMRTRLEELNGLLALIRSDRPSRALEASPQPEVGASVAEQRGKLEDDMFAARDATQQRLADAVAALETIRLGLLRMQAGSGSVESLTGDLAAARDVAGDIDRLLEAQGEVDRLLKDG